MPPAVQGVNNSLVLELLMNLSSHMLVTEEYISQHKKANTNQSPAKLVRTGVDTLQPSREQLAEATPREKPTKLTEEVHQQLMHRLRRTPRAAVYTTDDKWDFKEELVGSKRQKTAIKAGKIHMAKTIVIR